MGSVKDWNSEYREAQSGDPTELEMPALCSRASAGESQLN